MPESVVTREQYPSKVSAEFANETLAKQAVETLTQEKGFKLQQVALIEPDDSQLSRKLEPETRAIGSGVATAHLGWTIGGLLIGLAVAWLLVNMGPQFTRSSPVMTYLALAVISPMLGFFAGSVISFRPDHDRLVRKASAAAGSGHWTVVAHCADSAEKDRAKQAMDHTAQTL